MIFICRPFFLNKYLVIITVILYYSFLVFFWEGVGHSMIFILNVIYKMYMICIKCTKWSLLLLCIQYWTDTDSSCPSNIVWLLVNWGNWVLRSFPWLPRRTTRCWVAPCTCRQSYGRWSSRRTIERLGRWSPSMSVAQKYNMF